MREVGEGAPPQLLQLLESPVVFPYRATGTRGPGRHIEACLEAGTHSPITTSLPAGGRGFRWPSGVIQGTAIARTDRETLLRHGTLEMIAVRAL